MKPRKIHIEDKIIKWKLHLSPFGKSYIGIWDGKYHKVGLSDFIRYVGEPDLDFSELEEYYINHNGNEFIPQLTPSNIKRYYLNKIKLWKSIKK